MKYSNARKLLGLENAACTLTVEIVTEAFRAKVKAAHPDTALPGYSTVDMDELTTAKKIMLADLSGADLACPMCKGSGKVRAKFGVVKCISCRGTGDKL